MVLNVLTENTWLKTFNKSIEIED